MTQVRRDLLLLMRLKRVFVSAAVCLVIGFLIFIATKRNYDQLPVILNTGDQNDSSRYVSLSCVCRNTSMSYCFLLPITTRFWKRIGRRSLVTIIRTNTCELSSIVEDSLNKQNAIVRYMDVDEKQPLLSLSTLVRIFATIGENRIRSNDLITTSDVDIFPIDKSYFSLTTNSSVLITNAHCCGTFPSKNGRTYKMYPMTTVTMKTSDWRDAFDEVKRFEAPDISEFVENVTGMSLDKTSIGSPEWYADQMLVSMEIAHFAEKFKINIEEKGFDLQKRLDRSQDLSKFGDLHNYIDIHFENTDRILNEKKFIDMILQYVKILLDEDSAVSVNEYVDKYLTAFETLHRH